MPAAEKPVTASAAKVLGPSTAYLVFYNFIQVMGWSAILFTTTLHLCVTESNQGLYGAIHVLLKIFQTAAILEVVHVAVGIVRSNLVLTLVQVTSRVVVVWMVMAGFPQTQDSIGVTLCAVAWAIAEIVRYSFYAFSLVGEVPYLVVWCRYTFFIILYPTGVLGELLCTLATIPQAQASGAYSTSLPNKWNFSFSFPIFLYVWIVAYLPGLPTLYLHMLSQRKKVIGGEKKQKTN